MKTPIICFISAVMLVSCDNFRQIEHESPAKNIVESGEKFRVILPENHTTGFMWQLSDNFDSKKADYLNSVWHGNEKGVYFNFIAAEKGTTTLNFALIKYRDTTEVKSFVIEVK